MSPPTPLPSSTPLSQNDASPHIASPHIAYGCVVLVWATTPLAIHWCNASWSPISALTLRMLIALLVVGSGYLVLRRKLPTSRAHCRTYLLAALGAFPNMVCVYNASLYIPSGLVSVLFGMSPFFIGALSALWLHDHMFDGKRIIATLIAIGGLAIVFADQMHLDRNSWRGIALMITSNLFFASSSVLLKRESLHVDPWDKTLGALIVAVACLIPYCVVFKQQLPQNATLQSNLAILYLALIGSIAGMWCFYYVLHAFSVDRVALVPLITPILALLLGHFIEHEPLRLSLLVGSGTILLGLALYDPVLLSRWTRRLAVRG
jgi:drug/metabolite transporter (DMT)-like permease